MNKDQVKTIEDLQSYLNDMPFEEHEYEYYYSDIEYYVFEDGTLAMDKAGWTTHYGTPMTGQGLLYFISKDLESVFWDHTYRDEEWDVLLPYLDQASSLTWKGKEALFSDDAEDVIFSEMEWGLEDVFIIKKVYDTTYIIHGCEDFGIPDIVFDYGEYLNDYTINNVLLYTRESVPLQLIEDKEFEELDALSEEFDTVMRPFYNYRNIKKRVDGFVYSSKSVPEHYDKFMDEDGKPSLLMKEFDSSDGNWWMGLDLISNLEDPVLNKWFIDTYLNPNDPHSKITLFDDPEEYKLLDDPLLKEKFMGKRQSDGSWKATKNTLEIAPFEPIGYETHDSIQNALIDQVDIANKPATLMYCFLSDSNANWLHDLVDINEDKIREIFEEEVFDFGEGELENYFVTFIEMLGEWSYHDKVFAINDFSIPHPNYSYLTYPTIESIGNFIVIRPKEK